MRSLVPFFLLAVGCNKGESTASEIRSDAATESTTHPITNDTVEDDTAHHEETDCDSDFGSITGAVIYDVPGLEDTPSAANAELIATPSTGENIRISTNEEGRFSTELPADSYLLMADDGRGCTSDQSALELAACDTQILTLRLTECLDGIGEGDTDPPGDDTAPPGDDTDPPGDDTDPPGDDTDPPGDDTGIPDGDTTFVTSLCESGSSAPYTTSRMSWDGDVLVVSVEYGGCSTGHTFTPCWDGTWYRSMPPGANLQLARDDAGEMCMMMIYEDIRIDVSTIIDAASERTGSEPFQIRLDGLSIGYSF